MWKWWFLRAYIFFLIITFNDNYVEWKCGFWKWKSYKIPNIFCFYLWNFKCHIWLQCNWGSKNVFVQLKSNLLCLKAFLVWLHGFHLPASFKFVWLLCWDKSLDHWMYSKFYNMAFLTLKSSAGMALQLRHLPDWPSHTSKSSNTDRAVLPK